MRFDDALQELRLRARRPLPWVGVGAFGGMIAGFKVYMWLGHGFHGPLMWFEALSTPFLVAAIYSLLSPLPWLWTGDPSPRAGTLRGLAQGLVYHAVLVAMVWALDYLMLYYLGALRLIGSARFNFAINLLFGVPLMTVIGGFIAVGITTERERDQAAAQARDAKDRALQKQLSPHVLFNALNGLAELVRQDPVAAEQGLLDLAALYRTVLDHGQLQWAPLADERALVERFLAVERLRLGERLHVIWDWDEVLDRLMVPPLLLQPLVENAIKHGAGRRPGVFKIYISARHALGQVEVAVENEGSLGVRGGRQGIGLRNIAQRLDLHFPGESEAVLEESEGYVKAGFRISERALGVKR